MAEVTFRIERFNPETDSEPHWEDYTFEPKPGSTLLDCMNHIKWYMDGTLTYRMSCRSAICGSCAMKVNGGGQLVCNAQLDDHLGCHVEDDRLITVEPLGTFPVIKDLVTDFTPFWERMHAVEPYVKGTDYEDGDKETRMSPDDFSKIDPASTCIACGACYSECVSFDMDKKFLGPAALAKAQRIVHDTRDHETQERVERLSEEGGMWDCSHCFACVQACPKPVKPLYRILELRREADKLGVHDNNGSRHARAFVDIIEESGWLDEAKLPLKSVGSLQEIMTDLVPMGIKMWLKNKYRPNPFHLLPGMHHPEVPKMNEVTKIIEKTKHSHQK
ncbi:MAG: succinate dehydrogenase iron-sulfur subunit [Candidatus Poribacteria bacterium]|nr:succinate dehydrogenase iron-sulfur subunit [Candidatus Poribacteria bacterium]